MAKKRRITTDQARLLAIFVIQQAVNREMDGYLVPLSSEELGTRYFDEILPKKWQDGQTSEKSWEAMELDMDVQLDCILKGLEQEAQRIMAENPDFRYFDAVPS